MSECYCEFDNPCEACLADEERTCRKPRRCCECGTMIEKGERYAYFCGKWEGEIDSFSTCLKCQDLRKRCDFQCTPFGLMCEVVSQVEMDLEVEAFSRRQYASASGDSWIRKSYQTVDEYVGRFLNRHVEELA